MTGASNSNPPVSRLISQRSPFSPNSGNLDDLILHPLRILVERFIEFQGLASFVSKQVLLNAPGKPSFTHGQGSGSLPKDF